MIEQFSEEIKRMGLQIDAQAREQHSSNQANARLASELEELKLREAKHQQLRVSHEEETQRRVNADGEADRLRILNEQLQA